MLRKNKKSSTLKFYFKNFYPIINYRGIISIAQHKLFSYDFFIKQAGINKNTIWVKDICILALFTCLYSKYFINTNNTDYINQAD